VIAPQHPQTPGLRGCLADGPGCLELSRFDWPSSAALDLTIVAHGPLRVRLLDRNRREVAKAEALKGHPAELRLEAPRMSKGAYFIEIEGAPTPYVMTFKPPTAGKAHRP
jgi:hypothetical protein